MLNINFIFEKSELKINKNKIKIEERRKYKLEHTENTFIAYLWPILKVVYFYLSSIPLPGHNGPEGNSEGLLKR